MWCDNGDQFMGVWRSGGGGCERWQRLIQRGLLTKLQTMWWVWSCCLRAETTPANPHSLTQWPPPASGLTLWKNLWPVDGNSRFIDKTLNMCLKSNIILFVKWVFSCSVNPLGWESFILFNLNTQSKVIRLKLYSLKVSHTHFNKIASDKHTKVICLTQQ